MVHSWFTASMSVIDAVGGCCGAGVVGAARVVAARREVKRRAVLVNILVG